MPGGLSSRLPAPVSKGFARLFNSLTGPFDVVNYYGSCAGARIIRPQRMGAEFNPVIASLHRRLAREADAHLRRGMHYPVRWDPFFENFMTIADIYHYPTQHFGFCRRQLTLAGPV